MQAVKFIAWHKDNEDYIYRFTAKNFREAVALATARFSSHKIVIERL